ncbi:hypothetical protein LCGC14_0898120 [marine sediment metagenome]|uniref:HNH domain-containing protein n=1 Tax=marine sediment metagenome TaxID=412755 RepID=A0A0F9S436_9ZZZZ
MKICPDCGLEKALNAFRKDTRYRDGRGSYCRPCTRKRSKQWRCAHSARAKAVSACYYKRHSKRLTAVHARWAKAHPNACRAYASRYRGENPEKRRASVTRWARTHPTQVRENGRCRRAWKQAVNENFTAEMDQFVHEFWGYQCAVCRTFEELCVDHWLPLSKGFPLTTGNAALLCSSCNSKKGAKLPEAVYNWKFVKAVEQHLHKQTQQWSAVIEAA